MNRVLLLLYILGINYVAFSQELIIYGSVIDKKTELPLPFSVVKAFPSKSATLTDSLGGFTIELLNSDKFIEISSTGYQKSRIDRNNIKEQSADNKITIPLKSLFLDFEEITVRAPEELPSTVLHRNLIANKSKNDKNNLDSYEYELYTKIQFDLNNVGNELKENKQVKKLNVLLNYLDSTEDGVNYLPLILNETLSKFYFKKKPREKKEIITASRTTGVENLELNHFLGDMYLDLNIYDNIYKIFGKSFVSPTANNSRFFYKYYLEDSSLIDNQWCYNLKFIPKRKGELTFTGNMWIHDTSFAIKSFHANVSEDINLNFIQDFYFTQEFTRLQDSTWMLKKEKLIADIQLTKKSKMSGFYARKTSERNAFVINKKRAKNFYKSSSTVDVAEGAGTKTKEAWDSLRPTQLSKQEAGIGAMIDSLNTNPYFKRLKNITYMGPILRLYQLQAHSHQTY